MGFVSAWDPLLLSLYSSHLDIFGFLALFSFNFRAVASSTIISYAFVDPEHLSTIYA